MGNLTSFISFPGLGIGEFKVNSIAFNIFGRDVAWYGIIITSAIVLGFFYMLYRAKFEKVKSDDIYDLAIFAVIFAVIGARIYYVVTKPENFKTFYDVIAIWNGGIAIYGAIIGGGIATFVVAKIKKIYPPKLFDIIGPAVMMGQAIGRWGNFTNAEAFGSATELPWRMGIRNNYYPNTIYVHPTFFYESLWNLIGFVIINLIYKKKKYDGQIFLMYITWYGFGRMFIEGLRTDSLYAGPFRISQLVGLVSFAAGSVLLIIFAIKKPKHNNQGVIDNGSNN